MVRQQAAPCLLQRAGYRRTSAAPDMSEQEQPAPSVSHGSHAVRVDGILNERRRALFYLIFCILALLELAGQRKHVRHASRRASAT
jgi:hypothetical protein